MWSWLQCKVSLFAHFALYPRQKRRQLLANCKYTEKKGHIC